MKKNQLSIDHTLTHSMRDDNHQSICVRQLTSARYSVHCNSMSLRSTSWREYEWGGDEPVVRMKTLRTMNNITSFHFHRNLLGRISDGGDFDGSSEGSLRRAVPGGLVLEARPRPFDEAGESQKRAYGQLGGRRAPLSDAVLPFARCCTRPMVSADCSCCSSP